MRTVGAYEIGPVLHRDDLGSTLLATRGTQTCWISLPAWSVHPVDSAFDALVTPTRAAACTALPTFLEATSVNGRTGLVFVAPSEPALAAISKPLGLPELKVFGRILLEGLLSAHAQDLVHGNLHPQCIFGAKIAGFGYLQAVVGDAAPPSGLMYGDPRYLAPEQIRNQPATTQSDLFAAASLLHWAATATHAFEGSGDAEIHRRILAGAAPPLSSLRSDLPTSMVNAIQWGHQRSPAHRPADAEAMLRAWISSEEPGNLAGRIAHIPRSKGFPKTRWSLVLRAGVGRQPALEELCGAYWMPLYAYARKKGASEQRAADLTQGLFADLLARGGLGKLTTEGGRFRSWLLSAMTNYMRNAHAYEQRIKRGGDIDLLPLDTETAESTYGASLGQGGDAEALFERLWAQTLLDRARARLRAGFVERGQAAQFDSLEACLTAEGLQGSRVELAAQLGMTPGALKVAVHRMRKKFGESIRAEIEDTVDSDELIDEELATLRGWLSEKGALDL